MTGEVCFDIDRNRENMRIGIRKALAHDLVIREPELAKEASLTSKIKFALSQALTLSSVRVLEETISIYQGDIVRVDFQVPTSFDPTSSSNVISNTGLNLGIDLDIGEPTFLRLYRDRIVLGILGMALGLFILMHNSKKRPQVAPQPVVDNLAPAGQEPCVACLTRRPRIAYQCGHLCVCNECAAQISRQ